MSKVLHRSIIRKTIYGTNTTTLCGRMDNNLDDGWNVADNKNKVTCKHCLKAKETFWGKKLCKTSV